MPSLPTFDKAIVAALRKGDEAALERILRDGYPALVEDAGKQLGDPATAPRIVENAILQVWDERARLETPEELDKALKDAVRGNVVRHQRRVAALHRNQPAAAAPRSASTGPVSVDQAWTNVAAALHAPKVDAAASHRQNADASRHQTAAHMAEVSKFSWKVPVLTGVAVLAVTTGILWWVNNKGEQSNVSQSLLSPEAKHLASAPGQRASMTLSDDSKVNLGSDSQVIVPSSFADKFRVVRLEGTATFIVKAGEKNPFEVRAGNATFVAKGTEFSVRAFADEKAVTLKVKEGQVVVTAGAAPPRPVSAGGALTVAKDGALAEPSSEALAEAFSWIDGKVVIGNRSMKDALTELRRWYGLDLVIKDSSLLSRPVSLSVELSSKKDAIAALEKSGNVKFVYEGQTPTLRDAGPGSKAPKNGK
ncbi:MAG TPA: FecR domain-containing protein [Gemmatimonadaceae bacterium]|nr:FecR domain-containing protein [Gemmatimonadaceae bacterium]